ncbi:hypothetical protein [Methylobacillus sp. MM3]|uniref:hypothetical protein n=1 Tax=Methylobacillus sp. MM3 TaxID=1848039 RepID=UPI001042754F|nr:hypothetical protein [Methylobacillus sp. MM3]
MLDAALLFVFISIWAYAILLMAICDEFIEKEKRFPRVDEIFKKSKYKTPLDLVEKLALLGTVLSIVLFFTGIALNESLSFSFNPKSKLLLIPVVIAFYFSYLFKRLSQLNANDNFSSNLYVTLITGYKYVPLPKRILLIGFDVILLALVVLIIYK